MLKLGDLVAINKLKKFGGKHYEDRDVLTLPIDLEDKNGVLYNYEIVIKKVGEDYDINKITIIAKKPNINTPINEEIVDILNKELYVFLNLLKVVIAYDKMNIKIELEERSK